VELNQKLDTMVVSGQALEAFDEHYADHVVTQENNDAPCGVKDFNR
jgi:hypothetical protein